MSPLKKLRLRKKLTLQQISSATGIDRTYLGRIERGIKKPSATTAEKIVSFFDGKIKEMEILWPERFIK
jgi:transcriptional regulator with XRE-family HTH domain